MTGLLNKLWNYSYYDPKRLICLFAALVLIGYTILLVMIIFISWILAKYERFEKKIIRNTFVVVGAFIGIFSFLMVFF